jgi:hypothetical protein
MNKLNATRSQGQRVSRLPTSDIKIQTHRPTFFGHTTLASEQSLIGGFFAGSEV